MIRDKQEHIPALDGVRAIAILMVMELHYFSRTRFQQVVGWSWNFWDWDLSGLARAIADAWPVNASMLGGTGVDLFFVLSGFLITNILLRAEPSRGNLRAFYARRTLRIFPLYYATLLGMFFVFTHYDATAEYLTRLPALATYTTNFVTAVRGESFEVVGISLDHFWSLAVEEQFYLLWPAIVFGSSAQRLRQICWCLIGVAVASRIYFIAAGMTDGAYYLLPSRIDSLAAGALLALQPDLSLLARRARLWLVGGILTTLAMCIDERAMLVVGHLACCVAYAGVIVLASTPGKHRFLTNPLVMAIGRYSYAIYVLHQILRPFLFDLFPVPLREPVVFAVVGMATCCFAGALSWHLFEKHLLALRRNFPMQPRQGERTIGALHSDIGSRFEAAWPAMVAGLLTFAYYLPSLKHGFVWDDKVLLEQSPFLSQPSYWSTAISEFFKSISPNYFRPLAVLSFIGPAWAWGPNASGVHLTNALLHAFNSALVSVLTARLTRGRVERRLSHVIATLTALVYGLHPALIESVAFGSSRFDLLLTTWVLLSLWFDTRASASTASRWAGVLGFTLAALLTKETGIVLPVVLWIWRLAVPSGNEGELRSESKSVTAAKVPIREQAKVPKAATRQGAAAAPLTALGELGAVMIPGLLAVMAYCGLRIEALGSLYQSGAASSLDAGSGLQHILLVGRSWLEYLWIVFVPFLSISPLHVAPLPLPTSDLLAWAGLVALIAPVLLAVRGAGHASRWSLLFAGGMVCLAPALNIVPLELSGGAILAERYLTLPLAVFCLLGSAWVAQSAKPLQGPVLPIGIGLWLIASLATMATILPNWKEEGSLWAWAAERAPTSAMPHVNLANRALEVGDIEAVLQETDSAIRLDPSNIQAWNNRGAALFHRGDYAGAQAAWEKSTELAPEYALGWSNLANALAAQGEFGKAEHVLKDQALRLNPNLASALHTLGALYLNGGRPDLAIPPLDRALALTPTGRQQAILESLAKTREPDTWLNLGNFRLSQGDRSGASEAYQHASKLGASNEDVAINQSLTLLELEAWDEARAVLTAALAKSPNDARLCNNFAILSQATHEFAEARKWYLRAAELAPEWELPKQNLQGMEAEGSK